MKKMRDRFITGLLAVCMACTVLVQAMPMTYAAYDALPVDGLENVSSGMVESGSDAADPDQPEGGSAPADKASDGAPTEPGEGAAKPTASETEANPVQPTEKPAEPTPVPAKPAEKPAQPAPAESEPPAEEPADVPMLSAPQLLMAPQTFAVGPFVTRSNLLGNADLEADDFVTNHTQGKWNVRCVSYAAGQGRGGSAAAKMESNQDAALEQTLDLTAGKTYLFSMWIKAVNGSASGNVVLGVKKLDTVQDMQQQPIDTTINGWKRYSVEFTVPTSGAYRIYVHTPGFDGTIYMDDASLVELAGPNLLGHPGFEGLESMPDTAGRQPNEWYRNDWSGASVELVKDKNKSAEGDACCEIPHNGPAVQQVLGGLQDGARYRFTTLVKSTGSGHNVQVGVKCYDPGAPELLVRVTGTDWAEYSCEFTYKPGAITEAEAYVYVENNAGGTTYVDAARLEMIAPPPPEGSVVSMTAVNGKADIVMNLDILNAPGKDDFRLTGTVNGVEKDLVITNVAYEPSTKTVTLTFEKVAQLPEAQQVETTVTYKGKTVSADAPFTVDARQTQTFYVSATDGDDTRDGLSEAGAFKTIDHLNTLVFQPGDKILFKKGDHFPGTFKPQGSGSDGHPIVIDSYGTASEKPVIEPRSGDNFPGILQKGISGGHRSIEVNWRTGIHFENVEWWEVYNLELSDKTYYDSHLVNGDEGRVNDRNGEKVFAAGIRVVNHNGGDLHHFIFDHLDIHHFRGPSYSEGKSSGGIHFNTIVDSPTRDVKEPAGINAIRNNPANRKSATHEIRITNCEIHHCGRSGVSFLTPWQYRQGPREGDPDIWADRSGDNWTTSAQGNKVGEGVLEYYPYTNFYFANNSVHHIDGDALIVDTVRYAVAEKNLIYETAIHLGVMHAAVGVCNRNADDTYIQYNEIFSIGQNATNQGRGTGNPSRGVPGDAQGIEIGGLNDRTWVQYNYVHDNAGGFMLYDNLIRGDFGTPSFNGIIRYNVSQNDYVQNHGVFHVFPLAYHFETYNNVFYLDAARSRDNNGTVRLIFNEGDAAPTKMYNNIFCLTDAVAANSFAPRKLDWQSNLFVNFTNLPASGDSTHPNAHTDPGFVSPGTAPANSSAIPTADSLRTALQGYKIKITGNDAGLAAVVDTGVLLPSMTIGVPDFTGKDHTTPDAEFFGGLTNWAREKTNTVPMTDFFGNAVDDFPDIGIHEVSTEVPSVKPLWVRSDVHTVDDAGQTVTLNSNSVMSQLNKELYCAPGACFQILRNGQPQLDSFFALTGDVVRVTNGNEHRDYTINVTLDAFTPGGKAIVPDNELTYSAGSQENPGHDGREGPAQYAHDDNPATFWHTKWGVTPVGDAGYMDMQQSGNRQIIGVTYLPRPTDSVSVPNGRVAECEIQGKNPDGTWTTIKAIKGTDAWDVASLDLKTVLFDQPVSCDAIRFKVTRGAGGYAAAAELDLIYQDTIAPATVLTAPAENPFEGTAAIRWTSSADAESYIITDENGKLLKQITDTAMDFTGLDGYKSHTLKIQAVRTDGVLSDPAEITLYRENLSNRPAAPTNVKAANVDETTATLIWTAPADSSLTGYIIRNGNDELTRVTGKDTLTVDLSGLSPDTGYNLEIYGVNKTGIPSKVPATVSFTTLKAMPGVPTNVQVKNITNNGATVTWSAPAAPANLVTGYLVKSTALGVDKAVTDRSFLLEGLKPGTPIDDLEIHAVNGDRVSAPAMVAPFTTKPIDYTALNKAIADADAKVQADYTTDSWKVMDRARTAGKALVGKAMLQKNVDDAAAALTKSLSELVSIKALDAVIAEAEPKKEADYSTGSWKPFAEARTQAETVRRQAGVTQAQADAAEKALRDSMNALTLKPEVVSLAGTTACEPGAAITTEQLEQLSQRVDDSIRNVLDVVATRQANTIPVIDADRQQLKTALNLTDAQADLTRVVVQYRVNKKVIQFDANRVAIEITAQSRILLTYAPEGAAISLYDGNGSAAGCNAVVKAGSTWNTMPVTESMTITLDVPAEFYTANSANAVWVHHIKDSGAAFDYKGQWIKQTGLTAVKFVCPNGFSTFVLDAAPPATPAPEPKPEPKPTPQPTVPTAAPSARPAVRPTATTTAKPAPVTVVENKTGVPTKVEVALPATMTDKEAEAAEEVIEAIKKVAEEKKIPVVESQSLNTAAQKAVEEKVTVTEKEAKEAIRTLKTTAEQAEKTRVVVLKYMDIRVVAVNDREDGNITFTVNLTPMMQTFATFADEDEEIKIKGDGANAVAVGDPIELEVTEPITVTIPIPASMAENNAELYVEHKLYVYKGSITKQDGMTLLTFENPHGFSDFTVTASNNSVADIGEIGYLSLEAAMNDVKTGDTINLLRASDASFQIDREISFTFAGEAFTGKIIAGAGFVCTQDGNTFTVKAAAPAESETVVPAVPAEAKKAENGNILMWFLVIAAIAAAGICGAVIAKRKKQQ